MRKPLLVLLGVVALLLVACTPDEGNHLDAVNAFRTSHGLPALQWDEAVYPKAHAWSEHLATQGRLSHSVLADGVPTGWRTIGENVAMNPSLEGAMTSLENSAPHRANLLNPKYDRIAIGVVQAKGMYWVTEVFIG